MRILISVPRETANECFRLIEPNLREALRKESRGVPGRSPEINVSHHDNPIIQIRAIDLGSEVSHRLALKSVMTTLGHEHHGCIIDGDTGKRYEKRIVMHV
ncbi:MAG: hypothetical protein JWL88_39 [Parcubacteria group bacterium]|nr:hypothetical protein [Parcubacteria group bacterium]